MIRIFLGGTCNGTTWREDLKEGAAHLPYIGYFDPIVENWTEANRTIEDVEKRIKCNVHLYVITSEMTGVFSIAEAIASTSAGITTIIQVRTEGFEEFQLTSLRAFKDLAKSMGAYVVESNTTDDLVKILEALPY